MPAEEGANIVVKLDDLLHARRMTLTELAERVGLTLANLSILKTGKAKAIRFSTLEAICRELECQPGDLLGYDAPQSGTRNHDNRWPASHGGPLWLTLPPKSLVALPFAGPTGSAGIRPRQLVQAIGPA